MRLTSFSINNEDPAFSAELEKLLEKLIITVAADALDPCIASLAGAYIE